MNSSEKLKPCAHCGGEVRLVVSFMEKRKMWNAEVSCPCGIQTREYRTIDKEDAKQCAITTWNTRTIVKKV